MVSNTRRDVTDVRFLASAGNRRGEAVVLEVGSENDALGERIDRSGGRGVGRIYATRQRFQSKIVVCSSVGE